MDEAARGVTVRAAEWPGDETVVKGLLRRYAAFLMGNPAGAVEIDLQAYERELGTLAERYAEPNGVLLIAFLDDGPGSRLDDRPGRCLDDRPAGCVAVKVRQDRPGACEMKRLWVEPACRSHRLGETLARAAINWSRDHGFSTLLLDTVVTAMPQAAALYRAMGFRETARHNDNPVAGLVFFELLLGRALCEE